MKQPLPSIAAAKAKARCLRAELQAGGTTISHGKSLELIARQQGYRDWNTLHAAIGKRRPIALTVGDHVRGHYLSQPFDAEIVSVETVRPGWFRIILDLDEPVDVVTFDSFSNLRRRVAGVVGPAGTSREKTSNGRPQLELDLA